MEVPASLLGALSGCSASSPVLRHRRRFWAARSTLIGLTYALRNAAEVELTKAEQTISDFMVNELQKATPNFVLKPFDDDNLPYQLAVRKHMSKGAKKAGITSKKNDPDSAVSLDWVLGPNLVQCTTVVQHPDQLLPSAGDPLVLRGLRGVHAV
jgi:hypothetical protein